ncbi:T6SS effector phospholipase Tle3 domain-containing protein [Aquitalea aquatica]|uniref:DUF3274 domain-containing protein n=1 Tax=Aquitalea aquatica TaxID=3044273 RepID=A0A838Y955_9NEIS|nr:DUF3274 domain-containing protein [Aquitalea magnusonii]MBA4709089.1 DUF3274 domain-containing protein [Aquitalea magnusonii]
MSSTATENNTFYAGKSSALLMPNRYKDHPVEVKRNHVGVYILVHGVNDVGVSYPEMDIGLCAGLNERLDRVDLFPNDFRLPKEKEAVVTDPDAVFYQRVANDRTNSPVIHFHWGYRAIKDDIAKKKVHGQVVDINGNRLDVRGAKMGGMFANATSNIPDMFGGHFKSGFFTWLTDKGVMDVAHSLKTCPDRQYMALAAKRLAALITQIRKIDRNETITLIAHSQGCLISLCAQAFLHSENSGVGYADCLIMNHPPYGLHESFIDYVSQSGHEQQTTEARVETLVNLVKLITDNKHSLPAFTTLAPDQCKVGRTGSSWTPETGKRMGRDTEDGRDENGYDNVGDSAKAVSFAERDNRGKVYLYFCPHDQTVGLANVQGIGTLGVPEAVNTQPAYKTGGARSEPTPAPVLSRLGAGFFQRVWTWRRGTPVGAPPGKYAPRANGEDAYDGVDFFPTLARVALKPGESVQVTGEALNPPFPPNLHHGEDSGAAKAINAKKEAESHGPRYAGVINMDPIDATDAIVKGGLAGKNSEKEALQHYQDEGTFDNSYHSSIVANREHHRWVTAMDVAIGQANCMDDPEWRELLMMIADWRSNFDQDKIVPKLKKYDQLDNGVKAIVEATYTYYSGGEFPSGLVPAKPPAPIVSKTRGDRQREQSA